jgi:hypothetical protein
MYDLAKRSLAFTVATGGLLLTGTAYSPALAVVGSGAIQGPARASGVLSDAGSASSPVNAGRLEATGTAGSPAGAVLSPPALFAPDSLPFPFSGTAFRTPIDLGPLCGDGAAAGQAAGPDACAAAPAAASVEAAADTPVGVCGEPAFVVATEALAYASACKDTAEGSAPTEPAVPASGTGGASATAVSWNDDGYFSGAMMPIDVPAETCGATAALDAGHPGVCAAALARSARADAGRRYAGTGSAEGVRVPSRLPMMCGDDEQTGTTDDGRDGYGYGCAPDHPVWRWHHCGCAVPPPPPPHHCGCTPPPPPPSSPPTWPTYPPPPHHCGCTPPPPPPSSPPTWPTYPPPPPPPHHCGCTPPPPPPSSPPTSPTYPPPPPHSPPTWPSSPSSPPTHPHPGPSTPPGSHGGGLAHTGADIGIALGVAGAALLSGLGLRAAARRREH